jgi:hypothetical protein
MNDYYLVFAGRKWESPFGKKGITWDIAGVFQSDTGENACLVAAQKLGVGTTFAVKGFAWGVDTVRADDADELGAEVDAITRLERMGRRLEERIGTALTSGQESAQLPAGDDHGE